MFLSSEYLILDLLERPHGADNLSSLTPQLYNYGGPNAMPTHQHRYQKVFAQTG
jgi:hypothetical protein